jgi:hypothetical protein
MREPDVFAAPPICAHASRQLLRDLRDGKSPGLPLGGFPVVLAPDLGEGHVLAAEKGAPNDRFILSRPPVQTRRSRRRWGRFGTGTVRLIHTCRGVSSATGRIQALKTTLKQQGTPLAQGEGHAARTVGRGCGPGGFGASVSQRRLRPIPLAGDNTGTYGR